MISFLFAVQKGKEKPLACVLQADTDSSAVLGLYDKSSISVLRIRKPTEVSEDRLIELERFHQRIAKYHFCTELCKSEDSSTIEHIDDSTLKSNKFFVKGKYQGYPSFAG